jgi:hypothetical protein
MMRGVAKWDVTRRPEASGKRKWAWDGRGSKGSRRMEVRCEGRERMT